MNNILTGKQFVYIILAAALLTPFISFALNTVATGYRTTTSVQTIDAHGVCRDVQQAGSNSYFVPTNTANEWNTFLTNKPTDISATTCTTCQLLKGRLAVASINNCVIEQSGPLHCWVPVTNTVFLSPLSGNYQKIVSDGLVGDYICGLRTNGNISCAAFSGTLKSSLNPPSGTFVDLVGVGGNLCATRADGTLACWGEYSNITSNYGSVSTPSGTFKSVVNTTNYSCGLRTNNSIHCWGGNAVPTSADYAAINNLSDSQSIHYLYDHSNGTTNFCVLDNTGRATCTNTTTTNRLSSYRFFDMGSGCGLTLDGEAVCSTASSPTWSIKKSSVYTISTASFYYASLSGNHMIDFTGRISSAENPSTIIKNLNTLRCN